MFKIGLFGTIAGIISGMFASGGGLILVPVFKNFFDMEETKARGTCLACILPMVLTASFFYFKSDTLNLRVALFCAIGGIVGGGIGARLLKKIPEKYLAIVFDLFLVYAGITMLIK